MSPVAAENVNKSINYFEEKDDMLAVEEDEQSKFETFVRKQLGKVTAFNDLTAMQFKYSSLRDKIETWRDFIEKHNVIARLVLVSFAITIYLNSDKNGIFGIIQTSDKTQHILRLIVYWLSITIFGILILCNIYYIIYWHCALSRIGQWCDIKCVQYCGGLWEIFASLLRYLENTFGKIQSSARIEIVCLLTMVLGVMSPTVQLCM